jgi:hypothetical protein
MGRRMALCAILEEIIAYEYKLLCDGMILEE